VEEQRAAGRIRRRLAEHRVGETLRQAPGAKTIHHPYLSGLLEHSLSLMKLIVKVVENYKGIDVDLLLMGGFLHDIGKVYEFTFDRAVDYTDAGQLLAIWSWKWRW